MRSNKRIKCNQDPERSGACCFPPISSFQAQVLILGSFPGVKSLQQQQYYAHPRNAFWPLMADVLGFDRGLSYEQRLAELVRRKIALWDVYHHCSRRGSLDTAIVSHTAVCNDFRKFFNEHRFIKAVFFNGSQAERIFQREVKPALDRSTVLACMRLPSTSPAMATLKYFEKLEAWRVITDYC